MTREEYIELRKKLFDEEVKKAIEAVEELIKVSLRTELWLCTGRNVLESAVNKLNEKYKFLDFSLYEKDPIIKWELKF